ncbi:MAG: DUF21 domain-containing protein, partial [Proteobacteria bacterium]|nr:DUF21 domain-containing protein [Pseudomonadota bacterium]NIS69068.1 DUF21 domain-containing protein [Pseudomonadota bacterium]
MILKIILLGVFLILSGFFSGSETAMFSLGHGKLRGFARSKVTKKRLIAKMMKNPVRLLAALLLGNIFVNIAAASLGENIVSTFLRERGAIALSTLAMTLLILAFGEITPKTIAVQRSETVALWVSKPLDIFSSTISPIRRVLRRTTEFFLALLG